MTTLPAGLRGRHLGKWLERIGTAVILALAAWYWLQYFNLSTNLMDEGSTAAQALRLRHGDLIYRDFFTVVTPASYYTVAWLFRIFGEHLMVLRWTALVTGLGIALLTLIIARRISAWPFAAAAALMTTVWGWFLVTPNFYSLEAALFSLAALACYVWGAPSWRWMIATGFFAGLTAMTKQNVGAYTSAGIVLVIWASCIFDTERDIRGRLQMSAQFIGGICIPVIPTLLYLIAAGAGPYLYESWIYYPLIAYTGRFARPFPDFYPISPDGFDLWVKLVLYLPFVVYPLALVAIAILAFRFQRQLRQGNRRRELAFEGHALLAITVVGMLTMMQAWPRADVTHILFGLQPAFIVFGYLLFCAWRVTTTSRALAAIALPVALAPMVLLLWKGDQRTDWEYQNYFAPVRTERGTGIFTGSLDAQRIDVVTSYIREHTAPDDPVFVVPWASGFNFLADRANPTRSDLLLFEDPDAYPCLLSRLDERPPKYVIYGYTWDVDDKHFRDYAAPVDRYIRSRYAIEFTTDGYEIWRRVDDAPQAPGRFPRACQPRRFRFSDWSSRRP